LTLSREGLRTSFIPRRLTRQEGNKAAEHLRRLDFYRQAKRVFASPAPELIQARVNTLADGKELVMPAPGLKEGFYLLTPYVLPFRELTFAVTLKGLLQYGRRLERQRFSGLGLDLMLTAAVAVDRGGGRLGEGQGFFDLACAALYELGAVTSRNQIVGVVAEGQIVPYNLPLEPWDVRLNGLLTPSGYQETAGPAKTQPVIYWEAIPLKRVRKMTPVWQVYQKKHPLPR
jgi:5-formyltetrahydrofolate cyclo-ligase